MTTAHLPAYLFPLSSAKPGRGMKGEEDEYQSDYEYEYDYYYYYSGYGCGCGCGYGCGYGCGCGCGCGGGNYEDGYRYEDENGYDYYYDYEDGHSYGYGGEDEEEKEETPAVLATAQIHEPGGEFKDRDLVASEVTRNPDPRLPSAGEQAEKPSTDISPVVSGETVGKKVGRWRPRLMEEEWDMEGDRDLSDHGGDDNDEDRDIVGSDE